MGGIGGGWEGWIRPRAMAAGKTEQLNKPNLR